MTRPLDWGDKNPSDVGDVPPISPITGFSEVDYVVDTGQAKKIKVPKEPKFVPPKNKVPTPEPQSTFQGVIVEKVGRKLDPLGGFIDGGPQKYYVLREDGRRIIGETFGNDGNYNDFEEGDTVVLTAAPEKDRWWLTGHIKNRWLPVYELTIEANTQASDQTQKLAFTIPTTDTVEDGQDQLQVLFRNFIGEVECRQEDDGLYDISWGVNVLFTNPDSADGKDLPTTGIWCPVDRTPRNQIKTPFNHLRFDKNLGFIEYLEVENNDQGEPEQVLTVSLNGGNTDYTLHQPAGGGQAEWVGDLDLAGAIKVGKQLGQGWLKIENNGGVYVWHGHGKRSLKYLWPDNEPKVGTHLMLKDVTGEAIQLKHSAPGGNGYITALDCSYNCQSWTVQDGLIVAGPGISSPTSQNLVVLDETVTNPYKPCV